MENGRVRETGDIYGENGTPEINPLYVQTSKFAFSTDSAEDTSTALCNFGKNVFLQVI